MPPVIMGDPTVTALEILSKFRDQSVYRGRAYWLLNGALWFVTNEFWRSRGLPTPDLTESKGTERPKGKIGSQRFHRAR